MVAFLQGEIPVIGVRDRAGGFLVLGGFPEWENRLNPESVERE
jgi:hypothetical protein